MLMKKIKKIMKMGKKINIQYMDLGKKKKLLIMLSLIKMIILKNIEKRVKKEKTKLHQKMQKLTQIIFQKNLKIKNN